MHLATARWIIEALADGVDPMTGDVLDPSSPVQSPDVIRALHFALATIDQMPRTKERTSARPGNAWKSWSTEDEQKLSALFDSGQNVADLARTFGRTQRSIAARLVHLGKIPDRQSAFVANLQEVNRRR